VIFNIPDHIEGKDALSISPRFQLIDDGTEEARTIHTHKSGANYDIEPPAFVVTNPPNQYNELRLVVNQGQVEHWINGIKVLNYQLNSEEWKYRVQASGYAEVQEDYGQATSGQIALYAGKGQIWFRNIRIREL
jgi:hypothetical protein